MYKDTKQCPVCDSTSIEIQDKEKEVKVPFAKPIKYRETICTCHSCGASTRLDSEKQEIIEQRIYESAVESIPALLEDLNRREYSDSRIERCFDLEKGTIDCWKKKQGITPEIVALVRFLYSMPWLITIAEDGYNLGKFLENYITLK